MEKGEEIYTCLIQNRVCAGFPRESLTASGHVKIADNKDAPKFKGSSYLKRFNSHR